MKLLTGEKNFNWRGGDVSRIESLSDIVYGFALTLLVVSLEVPTNYSDLKAAFSQIPSFAASCAILVLFWYENYLFHRRYGMEDLMTIFLTIIQLFIVLFYIYPLKFLSIWLADVFILRRNPTVDINASDMPQLMVLYGLGWIGIYSVFFFLYRRARKFRSELELTDVEFELTLGQMSSHRISIIIGLISIVFGLVAIFLKIPFLAFFAGIAYSFMGPLQWWNGTKSEKKIKTLLNSPDSTSGELDSPQVIEGDSDIASKNQD